MARRHGARRGGRRVASGLLVGALAGALSVAGALPASAAPAPASGCAAVETIAVRGTGEPAGGGSIAGPLAAALRAQLPQTVQTHNLSYPASSNYFSSVRQGVSALQARLQQASSRCPGIAFVLIGFSQGAQVVGDTLAAASVPAAGQIDAVTLFGDPAFNSAEAYNLGSFQRGRNGVAPRRTGALRAFADEIGSFCRGNDTICQRGSSGSGHFQYSADRQAAVNFVAGELGGAARS